MENENEFVAAILDGNEQAVASLLDEAEDSAVLRERIANRRPTNHCIGFDMTLLQLASVREREKGNTAKVLLERGALLDLHSACGLGHLEQIDRLVGERPGRINEQVDTYFPIQLAITAGRASSIERLMQHGEDANRELRKVAYFGWEDDARSQDYTPWRPIHMAALWGFNSARIPVAQELAAAGADLNALSPLDGFRPIHLLAMSNRVEMIRWLVGCGVEVDSRTDRCDIIELVDEPGPMKGLSNTPLMVAAAEGFADATACLIELGADPTAVNDQGLRAMDFAQKRFWKGQPYERVVEILSKS
ncbi:MAG: hypothetical protein Aurels2KO_30890 [Aureliella sp.]